MFIIRVLAAMLATLILGNIMAGIYVESWVVALVFAFVLTLINVTVGRLVKLLGCLFQLVTFGLFGLLVNVWIIQFVDNLVDGIAIDNWGSALVLSIAISLISWVSVNESRDYRRPNLPR